MPPKSHNQEFVKAALATAKATAAWKSGQGFGASNRGKVIQEGMLAGVINCDSWKTPFPAAIAHCVFRVPPADDVFFSIVIEKDSSTLFQRLQTMTKDGDNNNVRFYLANDGKVYLERSKYRDKIDLQGRADLSPPIEVDRVLFAIYPPIPSAKRSLLVRDFIGYMAELVGSTKLFEIRPWASSFPLPPKMQRMPATIKPAELARDIESLGGYYVEKLVERYHSALNHLENKHFVILTGISGTGKTSLVKRYAYAVHGLNHLTENDPFYIVCPVRPDWTDPSGVLGYHDVLSGRYIVTPFLQAILLATAYRDVPVFVCLDEMNIARVEFYFADVLSALETGAPIHLHSNSVPLQGSDGEQIPHEIMLPSNLFITATINVDESTQPVSDKVLDRANLVDMSQVDIAGFLSSLSASQPRLRWAIKATTRLLIDLDRELSSHRLGFGYRTAAEFVEYCAFASRSGSLGLREAIDSQITQKVVVKLRGTEAQRPMLRELTRIVADYPLSSKIVAELTKQLDEYESFQSMR